MTMHICVPSSGRADRQITLRNLRKFKLLDRVTLCVPEDQLRRYQTTLGESVDVVGVPKEHDGIAATREWLLCDFADKRGGVVLMVDDDMDFCFRPRVDEAKLLIVETREKMLELLDVLEGWLLRDKFVHVGVSARQGNNNKYYDENRIYGLHAYRDATRMMNMYAYDARALKKLPLEFGRVPVMEDFDLTLQLLRLGKPNRVSFEFCWNQRDSGATGGCSRYRTPEMQADAARRLAELHPDFVKVVLKQSKSSSTSWKGMKERVDVIVAWRKALESAS